MLTLTDLSQLSCPSCRRRCGVKTSPLTKISQPSALCLTNSKTLKQSLMSTAIRCVLITVAYDDVPDDGLKDRSKRWRQWGEEEVMHGRKRRKGVSSCVVDKRPSTFLFLCWTPALQHSAERLQTLQHHLCCLTGDGSPPTKTSQHNSPLAQAGPCICLLSGGSDSGCVAAANVPAQHIPPAWLIH